MAWTSPSTQSTGTLITAAIWNTDLVDNLSYLKTQTDLIDDCSYTIYSPGGGRAIDATEYQNTSGKIMVVTVCAYSHTDDTDNVRLTGFVKATSPANTALVDQIVGAPGAGEYGYACITFVVPPTYYYKVQGSGDAGYAMTYWTEWLLH